MCSTVFFDAMGICKIAVCDQRTLEDFLKFLSAQQAQRRLSTAAVSRTLAGRVSYSTVWLTLEHDDHKPRLVTLCLVSSVILDGMVTFSRY